LEDSHFRTICKAVTWRFTATLDTLIISWIVTGEPVMAFTITGFEFITKSTLYWLHERVWVKLKYIK